MCAVLQCSCVTCDGPTLQANTAGLLQEQSKVSLCVCVRVCVCERKLVTERPAGNDCMCPAVAMCCRWLISVFRFRWNTCRRKWSFGTWTLLNKSWNVWAQWCRKLDLISWADSLGWVTGENRETRAMLSPEEPKAIWFWLTILCWALDQKPLASWQVCPGQITSSNKSKTLSTATETIMCKCSETVRL